ncbi:MAG TPA: hypothetical protein VFT50_10745 [Baekduia sp.]|nr:hypothetical protein [Baekduia sp.]
MSGGPDRRVAPPSGMAAPREAPAPDGEGVLDLVALAEAVCARYYDEFSDEDQRYGEAARLWCVHDNQHLLNWAALDVAGSVELDAQVAWLARVLEARAFPLDRLARNLELDAVVVRDAVGADAEPMATALERAAAMVRERGTFLDG